MLLDGIKLLDDSNAVNFLLASGDVLPSGSLGELFYKTGASPGLYAYNGAAWAPVGVAGNVSASPYDIAAFAGGRPTAGAIILYVPIVRTCSIPTNAAGSIGSAVTASTSTSAFTLYKNNGSFGTIVFSVGSLTPTFTVTATSFASGDTLKIVAPATQDATLSDIGITLNLTV